MPIFLNPENGEQMIVRFGYGDVGVSGFTPNGSALHVIGMRETVGVLGGSRAVDATELISNYRLVMMFPSVASLKGLIKSLTIIKDDFGSSVSAGKLPELPTGVDVDMED